MTDVTPSSRRLQLYAEVAVIERTIVLRQLAIYPAEATAENIGVSTLRTMAHALMEEFDVDCIRIEEARRTTGAFAGRVARTIEFRRRARKNDLGAADA